MRPPGWIRDDATLRLYWNALFVAWQGESFLLAGRPEEAAESARRSLRFARERKERGNEAWALRLLGEIYCHPETPDADKAQDHYVQALARADELGMRPLSAHCHLGLGKLYRRTGERSKAQEHLSAASTMLRDMDMRFWLERAEAEKRISI